MLNKKSSKSPLRLERCTSTLSQYGHVRAFLRDKTFPRLCMFSHATCSLSLRKANEVALVVKEISASDSRVANRNSMLPDERESCCEAGRVY